MNKAEAIQAIKDFGKKVEDDDLFDILPDVMSEALSLLMDSIRTRGGEPDLDPSQDVLGSLKIAEAKLDGRLQRARNARDLLSKGAEAAVNLVLDVIMEKA